MDNKSIILLLYVGIFAVVYFFFIRPQSQKAKKAKDFVDTLEKGAKVVLTSGIHGVIDKVEETTFLIEVDKMKIRVEKSGVSGELTEAIYGEKKA